MTVALAKNNKPKRGDTLVFHKSSSHLEIPGSRTVTWNKFHAVYLQFWRDLWISLLSGTFCSVRVYCYTFLSICTEDSALTLKIFGATIRNSVGRHTSKRAYSDTITAGILEMDAWSSHTQHWGLIHTASRAEPNRTDSAWKTNLMNWKHSHRTPNRAWPSVFPGWCFPSPADNRVCCAIGLTSWGWSACAPRKYISSKYVASPPNTVI
jgi:hypothetical protein